jgi:hypothetical protein
MPVLLRCDCPGCTAEIPAILVRNVITAPKPWWAMPAGEGLVIACKTEHLNLALPGWKPPATSSEEPQT